jgi:hypothetical protein
MHGMLSLGVLVAAFTGVAAWAAYVSVRLYRAYPVSRGTGGPVSGAGGPVSGAGGPVSDDPRDTPQ